ncbi:MAG: TolC family protein, partial [Planctomycetota bacterium]
MINGFPVCDRGAVRAGATARLLAAAPLLVAPAACTNVFEDDYFTQRIPSERLREIEPRSIAADSRSEPVSVEEMTQEYRDRIFDLEVPEPPATLDLSLADLRASTLSNNLDLEVQFVAPSIAQADVDAEEAKFEWTFRGSGSRTKTDSPSVDATQTSQGEFDQFNLGLTVPLRTGGTVNVDLPFSETTTNAAFSANEFNEADLRFALSQPLLRDAGFRANTHSIRVARFNEQISEAQTKLEAIRVLANADRAYWRLYAAQRELEVRYQQYELA